MLFKGLIPAMVTPFKAEGFGIDEEATQRLVNWLIDGGVSGLFILGTNGESYMMTEEEKLELIKYTVKYSNGRVPVYAGTGCNSTLETIELSKKVEALGVDALSVITPYFASLTDEELYLHYEAVAKSVNIPVMLYNIPKRTGNDLSPELVAKLAKIDNILGIKDSSGDIDKIKEYLAAVPEDVEFHVLSGSDGIMFDALNAGVSGVISGTSNVITKTDQAIVDYFNQGELEKSKEMHSNIQKFRTVNHKGTEPSVIKHALRLRGVDVGDPRKPIQDVNSEIASEIEEAVKFYEELEATL